MQFLVFILTYPFIYLLSVLPMKVLYAISDFFYMLFYYVIGYRKNVVLENLKLAFPDKQEEELRVIRKKFFRHFTDLFMESVKAFTMSEKMVRKRYRYKNPEILNELMKKGKSIALVGAHQANWEWSISLPLFTDITCYGAYTKLGNKYFEKVVKNSRQKFGFIGYKTSETIKNMASNFDQGKNGLYLLLSDQSPQVHKTHYWRAFMGVKVPIHTGAEMLSKKFDMAVVNYSVRKVKRGFFEVTFETITESPKEFPNYKITDHYLEITERNIKEQPEYYLWSHKRFKHKDKVPKEWL